MSIEEAGKIVEKKLAKDKINSLIQEALGMNPRASMKNELELVLTDMEADKISPEYALEKANEIHAEAIEKAANAF